MTNRIRLLLDIKHELDMMCEDDTEDVSYQYISTRINEYEKQQDTSITTTDFEKINNIINNAQMGLIDCYNLVIDYLELGE